MTRYCAQCGAKLEDNEKFCSECGSMIGKKEDTPKKKVIVEDADETTDKVKSKPNNNKSTKNSSFNILICIVGIVVVFIVLFGVISLFTGGGTSVNGVSFNIPDGYKSDNYVTSQWEKNPNVKNYEVKGYSNDYGDTIAIAVSDVSKNANIYSVTDGKPITIHGKEGVIQYFSGEPLFMYIENGKYIGISAPDKSTINEIIR